MERSLKAILVTDMVGYSRLMAWNETEIYSRQKQLRATLIDPRIDEHNGRVIKSTGDGVLVIFDSVVDALRCAVAIQLKMSEHEQGRNPDESIVFRIGINLGDIILEEEDIYGDGVNLAARLVPLAEPGGICVSKTVIDHVKGRVSFRFDDLGEMDLKNIPDPVSVYRVDTGAKHTKGANDTLKLGEFSYDRSSGVIADADGNIVHMRKQSQHVLAILAEEPGTIVSKEMLVEKVWPNIATTDDSLVQCITDIRKKLGRPTIQTFPKKGYRLNVTDPKQGIAPSAKPAWRNRLAAACVLFILGLSSLLLFRFDFVAEEQTKLPVKSIAGNALAVLPFANLSGNPELRYFSDGLSEDLTTDLSKISKLTVISFASSVEFQDAEKGFQDIAEDLGVRYLVRGTVRHQGERVRINVSLIDPFEGGNLWAERFDRDRKNPFDVQEEVTRSIVKALALTLGAEEAPARSINADAYYMLLRGLEPLREFTARGNIKAREYFERALALDPGYARAHANIAITFGRETIFRYHDEIAKSSIEKGLQAAVTAIQLDPNIPDAYFSLGVLNLALGEHVNALAAVRHAIRLDPNYADGFALLAEVAVHGGDLDEALSAIQRAKLLHPHFDFSYDWIEGHILFQLERYDEAQPFLERVVTSNPDFFRGLITLAANYGQQGKTQAANNVLAKAKAIKPEFVLSKEADRTPYQYETRRKRLSEGLKLASEL